MPGTDKLTEFAAWVQAQFTGDLRGEAPLFFDRFFQASATPG